MWIVFIISIFFLGIMTSRKPVKLISRKKMDAEDQYDHETLEGEP